jgi:glycosyltransferase involved in cell wall biosynthesis
MKPSILFIVPDEYETLKKKGVDSMILERDEDGFFGKVITLHPCCSKTRSISLNKSHEIYEVGFDLIPESEHWRLLMYAQYPAHFFRVIWNTVKLVKKYRINLIRANDPFWMGLFGYLTSRICRIPFCVSIHADYEKRMALDKGISIVKVFGSYKLAKLLARFILSKADRVMPIRETLGVQAVANGADIEKIRVIPHGIDLSPFRLLPAHNIFDRFGVDPGRKIISFAGRLTSENYVNDILDIARKLQEKRQDFTIVIAGGGKEESRIKYEVFSDAILERHVFLLGFQPKDICFDLRRASDVSLCLMAGFSLIEACAAGRPVVSYDVEWHYELVKSNQTGFLIPEHDVNGAVEALDWLLDHPGVSEEMGKKAKALAFEHHDLKSTSKIKIMCYSELLSQGE